MLHYSTSGLLCRACDRLEPQKCLSILIYISEVLPPSLQSPTFWSCCLDINRYDVLSLWSRYIHLQDYNNALGIIFRGVWPDPNATHKSLSKRHLQQDI